MFGLTKLKSNKKGFVFTATIIFLVITILVFAVTLYKYNEEREVIIISDSSTLRLINLEDSIQQSIKNIFLADYSLKLESNNTDSYDRLIIKTSINNSGETRLNLNNSLDNLSYALTKFYPESSIDVTPLKLDPRLYIKPEFIFTKNTIPSGTQEITFSYNESGVSTRELKNITITIESTSNMVHIDNNIIDSSVSPHIYPMSGTKYNLIIKTIDIDGIYSGQGEVNYTKTFSFNPLSTYVSRIQINNSDNTYTFFNITFNQSNDLTIKSINADANIILDIKYNQTNITNYLYHPKNKIININFKNSKISKKGSFKSSIK